VDKSVQLIALGLGVGDYTCPFSVVWGVRMPDTKWYCQFFAAFLWMGLPGTVKVRRSTWRSWLYVRSVRYRLVTKAYMLVDVAVGRAEKEVNSKRTVTCLVVDALV